MTKEGMVNAFYAFFFLVNLKIRVVNQSSLACYLVRGGGGGEEAKNPRYTQ